MSNAVLALIARRAEAKKDKDYDQADELVETLLDEHAVRKHLGAVTHSIALQREHVAIQCALIRGGVKKN